MAYMFLDCDFSTLTGVKMTYFYFVENVNKQNQCMLFTDTSAVMKSIVGRTVWVSAKVNSTNSLTLIEWIYATVVTKTYTMKKWVNYTKKGCWSFFKSAE